MRLAGLGMLGCALVACGGNGEGAPAGTLDAPLPVDSARSVDARVVAPVDAPPPSDAPLPDAMPCVEGWVSLLGNGDFDAGNTMWQPPGNLIVVPPPMPLASHSGAYVGYFGGYDNAVDDLYQTVMVPGSAKALRLRGYRCFQTGEATGAPPADHMVIELRGASGAVLESLVDWSNADAIDAMHLCSWVGFSFDVATPHAGGMVQLFLHGATNATNLTNFFLDSLVLEAMACQ